MYEKILEILDKVQIAVKEWTKYHPIYYEKKDAAKEISDMFRKFEEWKDSRLTSGKIIWHDGFYLYTKKYTLDDLFNYWWTNIREK